jgi:hypothetical protein
MTWGDWRVPIGAEIGIVVLLGLTLLAVAIAEFSSVE